MEPAGHAEVLTASGVTLAPSPAESPPRGEDVSVVVPARDAAETLGETLASVLAQRVRPGEVVVVDDGSRDATAEVARAGLAELERAGVAGRLLASGGRGVAVARNVGLAAVRGRWVAFLDADDLWHREKLAAELIALARFPGVVGVATDWVRPPLPSAGPARRPSVTMIGAASLLVLNQFQTSTVVAAREDLEAVGGFDPALEVAEDWDCWLRLAWRRPFAKLDWPYVAYRDRPGGVSKDLRRLHAQMRVMMARERARPEAAGRPVDELLAWHHLRFAVNFALERDAEGVRRALEGLRSDGVLGAAPGAARSLLAPFLVGRVGRRLPWSKRPAGGGNVRPGSEVPPGPGDPTTGDPTTD